MPSHSCKENVIHSRLDKPEQTDNNGKLSILRKAYNRGHAAYKSRVSCNTKLLISESSLVE